MNTGQIIVAVLSVIGIFVIFWNKAGTKKIKEYFSRAFNALVFTLFIIAIILSTIFWSIWGLILSVVSKKKYKTFKKKSDEYIINHFG